MGKENDLLKETKEEIKTEIIKMLEATLKEGETTQEEIIRTLKERRSNINEYYYLDFNDIAFLIGRLARMFYLASMEGENTGELQKKTINAALDEVQKHFEKMEV